MKPLLLLALAFGGDDETYKVTISVEAMHCDECRASVEANLKAMKGVKDVTVKSASVEARVLEKTAVKYRSLAAALPSDLKLKSIALEVRGLVGAKGAGFELKAKESGQAFALANKDDKDDVVEKLRKSLAAPPKYLVRGELVEKDRAETLLLSEAPEKAQWKDEKRD